MYFFLPGFFSLSMIILRFIHFVMGISCSFSLLSSFPLCGYTKICLSIHLLMDIWAISSFLLLQISLLQTFTYRFLYGYMLSYLSDKYPGVD